MTVLAGRGVFCRIVRMTFRPDDQMAFGTLFSDPMMVERPCSKGDSMTICAVLTKPIGYMILGARILIKMAADTGCCRVPVGTVSVAVLAFRHPVLSDEGITCLAMIELGRVPCLFRVALRTIHTAELVKMGIHMTLITIPAGPFILPFYFMTTGADNVIVHPF